MMRANLFKLIHSPMFYLSPLAVLAISLYNAFYGVHTFSNLLLKIDYLISFEFYRKLFILFAALPFSSNFADEWNSKVITNCISRRNVRVYAVSNITICFLSAFAVVFAGMMIYVFVQSAQMPLYDENSFFPPYGELIKNGAHYSDRVCLRVKLRDVGSYGAGGDGVFPEPIYRGLRAVCVQLYVRAIFKNRSRRISARTAVAVVVGVGAAPRVCEIRRCNSVHNRRVRGNFHDKS